MTITDATEQIYDRLKSCKGKYREIADFEPDLDYSWLSKFANRKITNPTVGSLETLERALDSFDRRTTLATTKQA